MIFFEGCPSRNNGHEVINTVFGTQFYTCDFICYSVAFYQ